MGGDLPVSLDVKHVNMLICIHIHVLYISLSERIYVYMSVCIHTLYIYIYIKCMFLYGLALVQSASVGYGSSRFLGLRAALMLNSIKTTQLIRKWQAGLNLRSVTRRAQKKEVVP